MARSPGFRPWRIRTGGEVGGPPIVAGDLVVVASSDHHLYAVDRRSGKVCWRHRRDDGRPSLWAPKGIGYGSGMVFLGRHSGRDRLGQVRALDAGTGDPRWQVDLADGNVLDVSAAGDAVLVNCGSSVRCLEASDGSPRWRYSHEQLPAARWDEPVVVDDVVLCAAGHGDVVLVAAIGLADGVERWALVAEGRSARVAGRDGVAVVATSDGLVAVFELDTGESLWSNQFEARQTQTLSKLAWLPNSLLPNVVVYTPFSAAMTAPVVTASHIFVGSANGSVYSFDRQKRTYWNWVTQTQVKAVCHAEGVVYAGFFDGSLAAYPEKGGELLWWLRGPIGRVNSMTCHEGVLYVSGGKCLAAFDAGDGSGPPAWRLRTRRVVSKPQA